MRAFDAVRRSDVCLLVVDSAEGLTEQDVKIIGYVHEQGKPSVIVMNKWDLIEKDTHTVNQFEAKLKEDLKFMDYYQSIYISAKTGQRVEKILTAAEEVYAHATFKVPTGELNDLIGDAVRLQEPPSYLGRRMRVFFSTQVSVCPPTFALFVNDERLLHFSYERYLENTIRRAYDFSGTPIRITVREKKDEE
jgi:GTP-binding protein